MKPTFAVPKAAITMYNQALDLTNKGNLQLALSQYQKTIEQYPEFIEAYNNLGEIYSQMGDRERAIALYEQALNIHRNYRVLLNLGVEYYNHFQFHNALVYFNEAVALKDDFLEGHFYAGMVQVKLKNLHKAETHLTKVIAIDKKHLQVNYLLSYIYYEWKEYEKAIECLDRIKDIADDKTFINKYYGFCYYYLGHTEKAIKFLTTALTSSPHYEKFKTYLQSLDYKKKIKEIGDLDKAIHELESKLMGDKPHFTEYTRLSMLYIFKGESQKAENIIQSYKETLVH